MANTKGVRLFRETSSTGQDISSYVPRDVSSLGIIAPFTITSRIRSAMPVQQSNTQIGLTALNITYGGANDDLKHGGGITMASDADNYGAHINQSNRPVSPLDYEDSALTSFTYEDWAWLQIYVDSNIDMYVRYEDDNTTTKPTSFTDEYSAGALNATPDQVLQEILLVDALATGITVEETERTISEFDEIYVEQL